MLLPYCKKNRLWIDPCKLIEYCLRVECKHIKFLINRKRGATWKSKCSAMIADKK